ncbi:MAG: DUF4157 domain-containing protein, partial [Sulfitobacter sp.]|uniref:eCIS core domain-containing protein n=1 Tax=Sulfitobacter sp. TaxID=1903071 RepID=UPI003297162A
MSAPTPKPPRRKLVTADLFEVQARKAERGTVTRIDTVAAAPRFAGLGEGRPLPGGFRSRAEAAMSADFKAVRLHSGPPAQSYLDDAGVTAMTAGPDILVSGDAALADPDGEALMLHELTHVLQQTGLRGPDGRLRATRRYSAGRPYADGGPLEGDGAPERDDLVNLLIVRHAALALADPHLVALIARLDGLTDLEGAPGATLAAEVTAGRVVGLPVDVLDMSAAARGLLYDLMKFGGFPAQARDLLIADTELMSVARHAPFLEYLATDPVAQAAIFETGLAPGTEPYRLLTRRLPAAMFNYLMGVGRRYQGIYDLDAYWDPLEDETQDWARLGRNDGHYMTGHLVLDLERTLGQFMGQQESQLAWILDPRHGMHFATLRLRQRLAWSAAEWASDFAGRLAPVQSAAALIEGLEGVAERATAAEMFWGHAIARLNTLAEADIDEIESLPESPLVERVRNRIERDGLHLLETPGRDYLSRSDYRNRRTRLTRGLNELGSTLSRSTRAAWTDEDAEAGPELGGEREVAGILAGVLEEISDTLTAYTDRTSGASDRQIVDLQRAQRVGTARILGWTGAVLGSTRLQARAEEVRESRDIEQHSLFLISDWTEDRRA